MNQANEFVIPSSKGELIRNNAPLIQKLFNVGLEFTSDQNTARRTGSEWVKVIGIDKARHNAEEFIKGITNPETRFYFTVPEDLQSQFSWKSNELSWKIQRDSNAVVVNDNRTQIHIQGSQIAVATAISLLEEYVNDLRRSKEIQHLHMRQQDQLCYNTQPFVQASACLPLVNSHHLDAYPGSIQSPEIISRGSKPSPSANQNPYQNNGSDIQKRINSLREFAMKLGYTSEQVDIAIQKCSINANENSLLQQLTMLYPCKYTLAPAMVTKGKIVKDSSAPTDQIKDDTPTDVMKNVLPIEGMIKNNNIASKSDLRHIVIDGSNVAMSHGNREVFSCKGIQICVDYFKKRNHTEITVFVPQWRKEASKPDRPIVDQQILLDLEKERILVFTPSRRVNGRRVVCYDDRYIVKFAADNDGIIVSNDNFRDLEKENPEWKQVIEQRLLMYTFVKDCFMPPDDPLGRHGPKLDAFLKKGTIVQPRLCPYKKKCTYGHKCKFFHPERMQTDSEVKIQNNPSRQTVENSKRNNLILYPSANSTAAKNVTTDNMSMNKQLDDAVYNVKSHEQNENHQSQNDKQTGMYQKMSCQGEKPVQYSDHFSPKKHPDLHSKQNNSTQETISKATFDKRSSEMQATLESIFPDRKTAIATLLAKYPNETDINKLVNLMLK